MSVTNSCSVLVLKCKDYLITHEHPERQKEVYKLWKSRVLLVGGATHCGEEKWKRERECSDSMLDKLRQPLLAL